MKRQFRVALLINPVAGLGGAVGLKGSDGERAARALAMGATSAVAGRVQAALAELRPLSPVIEWFAPGGAMGGDALAAAGTSAQLLLQPPADSRAADSRRAAKLALEQHVDLLLFAGGDGTARDVMEAVGERVAVLGIPAGVKMHSAVFALTPRSAGAAARRFLETDANPGMCARREVMDREFLADGQPASSPQLYGYLSTPQMPSLVQAAKAASGGGGDGSLRAVLPELARDLREAELVLLGPGATLLELKRELGVDGSLLGVDVIARGSCTLRDANEAQLWECVQGKTATLVLGVIGGQGFLLGRGNQPLSPRVLRCISRDHMRVLASAQKLASLPGSTLYVDTGDDALDRGLCGYLPVITGRRRSTLCPVSCGGSPLTDNPG